MKTLTVIPPAYFPSVETLAVILQADVVVWADTFQFTRQLKSNRTAIKSISGLQWLTVPILSRGRNKQSIAQVEIDPQHEWKHNHSKSMQVSYQNSPYYFFQAEELEKLLNHSWTHLNELAIASTAFLCRKMRIPFNDVPANQLPLVRDRTERVMKWMDVCECDTYLLPEQHVDFIDASVLYSHGLTVQAYRFNYTYHQLYHSFIENLSGLDLLFNEGEMSRSILQESVSFFEPA